MDKAAVQKELQVKMDNSIRVLDHELKGFGESS